MMFDIVAVVNGHEVAQMKGADFYMVLLGNLYYTFSTVEEAAAFIEAL